MAVLLITGIVLGSHFAFSQTVVISLLAAFLLIALFSYRNLIVRDIFFYISIVILGIVLYYNSNNDFSVPTSKSSKFHAVLLSSPKQHGKIISCDIVVTSGEMTGKRLRASIMRDTIENRYRHLEIGSGIVANAVIEKPMNFKEGNFNYERFLKSHGISGTAFITIDKWITKKIPLSSLSTFDLLQLKSLKYREKFIQKYRISGLEDNGLAIVSAMTLGEQIDVRHLHTRQILRYRSLSCACDVRTSFEHTLFVSYFCVGKTQKMGCRITRQHNSYMDIRFHIRYADFIGSLGNHA